MNYFKMKNIYLNDEDLLDLLKQLNFNFELVKKFADSKSILFEKFLTNISKLY